MDLDLEDFRRLGIRPHECRLTVIRRAAARSTRALAEKQLNTPSEQVALQLSRVTTSAYRLLDPRQRNDVNQRTHVGRILPTVLSWAGHTNFHKHGERGRHPAGKIGDSGRQHDDNVDRRDRCSGTGRPFREGPLSDAEMIELMELDSTPILAGQPVWTQSLCDEDLLETSPARRRWNRWMHRIRHPWFVFVITGFCIGVALGLSKLRPEDQQKSGLKNPMTFGTSLRSKPPGKSRMGRPTIVRETVTTQTDTALSTKVMGEPVRSNERNEKVLGAEGLNSRNFDRPAILRDQTVPPKPIKSIAESSDTDEFFLMGNAPVFEIANPFEAGFAEPSSELSTDWSVEPELVEDLMNDLVATELTESRSIRSNIRNGTSLSSEPEQTESFLPDPFTLAEPVPAMANKESNLDDQWLQHSEVRRDPLQKESRSEEEPLATVKKKPSPSQVRAARAQLLVLLPSFRMSVTEALVSSRVEELEDLLVDLDPGSAEHWTANLMMAELAWLFEDARQIHERLRELHTQYDVGPAQLMADAFVLASKRSSLPATQTHLVERGFVFADNLITQEELTGAQSVVDAIGALAESLEDAVALEYVDRYSESLHQALRLQETSARALAADDEEVNPAVQGILGRYHCLMLRQWNQGLKWLTDASDPRLAGVARQEMELVDDASAKHVINLSKRWLAISERATGVAATSMQLHAIDLLRGGKAGATALEKIELDEEIEEAFDRLPPFFQELPNFELF